MQSLFINHTTGEAFCQEDIELCDGGRRWKERKLMSIKVAKLMRKYDPDRAEKIRGCGTFLLFVEDPTGSRKLHNANFCRERLCPMCQWRRSLRLASQADKIYRRLTDMGYAHIFATLTVRNCSGDDLGHTIDNLYEGLGRLSRTVRWKRTIRGAYIALEVTYNKRDDTYHPHLHLILTVDQGYFSKMNADYWSKADLIAAWRKAMRLDYDPSVDIEAVKQKPGQSMTSACVEACKYPAKTAEITFSDTLRAIDYALRGRRLIRWVGVAADVRRELQLEDVEDGNLVHTDDTEIEVTEETVKIAYVWRHGLYVPLEVHKEIIG